MAFNLADVLSGAKVSNLDTTQEKLEYIELSKLIADDNNFYSMDGIEDLAASIELIGLQQPLRVRPSDDGSSYIIVSGHRRCRALQMLIADGKAEFASVPCLIDAAEESDAMRELRLIFANASTRKLNSYDLSRQAERAEALFYQLKEEGVEFPGRMRDHVAQACQISASRLARLKVIRDKLEPEALQRYEQGKIPESTAYELATLPAQLQSRVNKVLPKATAEQIASIKNYYSTGARWEPTCTCPDGKACTHADSFLLHDVNNRYSTCGGERCCLNCGRAYESCCKCASACSKAKAAAKEKAAEKKAAAEKSREKEEKKKRKKISKSAQRIVAAADAAKLSDDCKIPGCYGYNEFAIKKIRKFAQGDFGAETYLSDYFDFTTSPAAKAAKALGCSADYLCGLTEELHPAAPTVEPDEWEKLEYGKGEAAACCAACGDNRLEWIQRSAFCPNCGKPKIIK